MSLEALGMYVVVIAVVGLLAVMVILSHLREAATKKRLKEFARRLATDLRERVRTRGGITLNGLDLHAEVPLDQLQRSLLMDAIYRALFEDQLLTDADFRMFRNHGIEFSLDQNRGTTFTFVSRSRPRTIGPIDILAGQTPASDDDIHALLAEDEDSPTSVEPEPEPPSIWMRIRGE